MRGEFEFPFGGEGNSRFVVLLKVTQPIVVLDVMCPLSPHVLIFVVILTLDSRGSMWDTDLWTPDFLTKTSNISRPRGGSNNPGGSEGVKDHPLIRKRSHSL